MDLFNYKTGQWESHPEDDALNAKISSGEYGLPKGIEIPIVTPDGALASVPSDKATEAFKQGYRWQYKADRDVAEEKAKEKILEDNYGGEEATAAALGVARTATLGLSDAALAAAGLKEPVKEIKQRSPVASIAGEVAGAFIPVGAGGVAARLGADALKGTKALMTSKKASDAVARYGSAMVGSAVEGGLYGVGQGISDASLGDPSEIVENVVAGGGQGLLLGGMLGGVFQGARDAAPFIRDVVKAGADDIFYGGSSMARSAYKNIVGKAVDIRKGPEAGKLFRSVVDDVEGRSAMDATGSQAFQDAAEEAAQLGKTVKQVEKAKAAEAKQLAKEIAEEISNRERQIKQVLKNAPKESQEQIMKEAESLGWDLAKVLNNSAARLDGEALKFEAGLKANYSMMPAQRITGIVDSAEQAANALKKSGSRTAQAVGKSVEELLEAEVGNIRKQGIDLPEALSVADEFGIAKRLKERISGYKLKPADANVLEGLGKTLDESVLANHYIPDVAEGVRSVATLNKSLDDLRGMLSTAGSPVKKLPSVINDPIRAKGLDVVLSRIEEFYPDIVQVRQGFQTLQNKQKFLEQVRDKIRTNLMGSSNGKLSMEDAEQILTLLGKKVQADDVFRTAKTTRQKQAQIERIADDIGKIKLAMADAAEASVLDKYQIYARALGKEVSGDLHELKKFASMQEKLERLRQISPQAEASMAENLGKGALWFINPKVAAAVRIAESAASLGANPYRSVQTLSAIERFANSGAKAVSAAVDKTVKSLVSGKALKVARSAAISSRSMKEQRKEYERQKEILAQMSDPAKAAVLLEERIPYMDMAPNVQTALNVHLLNTSAFLTSKLPEAPQDDTTVFLGANPYPPSDTEMSKFLRYVEAAESPTQVIENIGSLTATPEEIETLRVLYPSIYKRLQDQVLNDITNNGAKLSYAQRLAVGELLSITTDPSLRGNFVQEMQKTYAEQMPDNQGGRPAGGGNSKIIVNLDAMETVATPTQRITAK